MLQTISRYSSRSGDIAGEDEREGIIFESLFGHSGGAVNSGRSQKHALFHLASPEVRARSREATTSGSPPKHVAPEPMPPQLRPSLTSPCEVQTHTKDFRRGGSRDFSRPRRMDDELIESTIDLLKQQVSTLARRFEKLEIDIMGKADLQFRVLEARTTSLEETFLMELRLQALQEQKSAVSVSWPQAPANHNEFIAALEKRLALHEDYFHNSLRSTPWKSSLEAVTSMIAEVVNKQRKVEESLADLSRLLELKGVIRTMTDDTANEHSKNYDILRPFEPARVADEMRILAPLGLSPAVMTGTSEGGYSMMSANALLDI